MNRHIAMTAVLILGVFLILAVYPLHGDSQGWITNSLSYKFGSRLTIVLSNEMRFETPGFSDRYLYYLRGMIAYRMGGGFYAAAGYHLEKTETLQFTLEENRFVVDVGWNKRFAGKFHLGVRLRAENRSYDADLAEEHFRFRLKVKLSTHMNLGVLKIRPFIAVEPFGDTEDKEINRYRVYAGAVFPVIRNVGIVLGYIRQTTKNRETLNVFNTGLKISL